MSNQTSKLAMVLFGIYLILYGGFVLLNAFSPETMESTPFAGINLAIWYGFGLIIAALVLALIYGFAPAPQEATEENASEEGNA